MRYRYLLQLCWQFEAYTDRR